MLTNNYALEEKLTNRLIKGEHQAQKVLKAGRMLEKYEVNKDLG